MYLLNMWTISLLQFQGMLMKKVISFYRFHPTEENILITTLNMIWLIQYLYLSLAYLICPLIAFYTSAT